MSTYFCKYLLCKGPGHSWNLWVLLYCSNNTLCTIVSQYYHCHRKWKTPFENFYEVVFFHLYTTQTKRKPLLTTSVLLLIYTVKITRINLPAKSFTLTFAPNLISSLTCLTSPRIAAICRGVSPRSFLLLTLSFCLEEEVGVFFCVGVVCKEWFKVESIKQVFKWSLLS